MEEIVHLGIPFLTQTQWEVITPTYEDFELIRSEGARFGNMFKCKLKSTNEVVAIKILTIREDQKNNGVPYSILNHVSILKTLNHPNIVKLHTVIKTDEDVEDVFLVFEYVDISLKRYLANPFPFDVQKLVKPFLRQALSGLAYLHVQEIIHRDLKPHNILLSFENHEINAVKLADFGVAKFIEPPLSPYSINMGNPCYKAPELLLGFTNYSTAIDIWSLGCIFAEMIKLQPLFIGKDGPKILTEIFCFLGTPTEETWPGVSSICPFIKAFDPPIKPKDLEAEFPELEPDGLDLLSALPNRKHDLIVSPWPETQLPRCTSSIKKFENLQTLVRAIRNTRAEYSVEPAKRISASVVASNEVIEYIAEEKEVLALLSRLDLQNLHFMNSSPGNADQSVHLVAGEGLEAYLPLADMVDISAEVERLSKRLVKMQKEYDGMLAKLNSPKFVEKAPEEVVRAVREKATEAEEKITLTKKRLEFLNSNVLVSK